MTGGVPRYLELINPKQSAEHNIQALCFSPNAPLLNEFERIFSDIFGKRSAIYKKIVRRLVLGTATSDEILTSCGRTKTGDFSEYLADLEMAGFVARDFTWQLDTKKQAKLSRYRLKDNYLRFYLKYIEPNKTKITKGLLQHASVTALPGWDSIIGLQFENLVLNNIAEILKALKIPFSTVLFANAFFQTKTKQTAGCQIDLLIQTKFHSVYVCEIKFSKMELDLSILDEVKAKIAKLKLPKNFSYRPVLIHVNGVRQTVVEEEYFTDIIDFGSVLNLQ